MGPGAMSGLEARQMRQHMQAISQTDAHRCHLHLRPAGAPLPLPMEQAPSQEPSVLRVTP